MGNLILQSSFLGGPSHAKKGGRTFQGSLELRAPASSTKLFPPNSKGSQYYCFPNGLARLWAKGGACLQPTSPEVSGHPLQL